MTHIDYSRRQFLHYAAAGTLAASLSGLLRAENGESRQNPNPAFKADVEIALTALPADVSIRPGPDTHVFKFHGKLLKGPQETLTVLPGYLGPIMNFQQGQKVRVFFYNELTEPCVAHWHGMHVPQIMDGHPMYAISKGARYVYEFEVKNPAGTNWYHAHTHELTATQVYQGLAGLITISDEHEQKLELPRGDYDIPLIIQDRSFSHGNQLRYMLGMHQRMTGFHGETILVNGQENSTISVKSRAYRLRILNGSNARIYKLGWNDGTPMTAIGTDGGLLQKPETLPYVMLAPAERIELWVDFSGREVGSELILQSFHYQGSAHRGMGGMRGGMGRMGMMGGVGQNETLSIARFHIAEHVGESPKLPTELASMRRLTLKDCSNPDNSVPIAIGMRHMAFQLNGRTFDMLDYQSVEKIPVNTIQRIRIFHENRGMGRGMAGGMGGMGMMMSQPHPIHLHGQQFQILSRRQNSRDGGYDSVKDGFINSGWKDTVLVMPGEEVEIIKPFNDYTGLFLYHCHNLEHEDMGMMRNFFVT